MVQENKKISRNMAFLFLLLFCTSLVMADYLYFGDGGIHDVDYVVPDGLAVDSGTTVNLLPGAWVQHVALNGDVLALGTINFYAGIVDGVINVYSSGTVTVYGSDFAQNGTPLDSSVTELTSPVSFVLTGQYDNGDPINLNVSLDAGAKLYLNWPAPEPNINVYPVSLEIDFGDIEVGQFSTGIVQVYNNGNADLQVGPAAITGDPAFTISIDPTPTAVPPGVTVDIEITFAPTAEGYVTASLVITSDDADQPSVDVFLGGAGVITEIPPAQQIQNIIAFYDQSIADGTILGYGPGNSPEKRVKALRCMLVAAGHLINNDYNQLAIIMLKAVERKTDGEKCPQDFVVGENVAPLNVMVNDLIADLEEQ